MSIYFFDFRLLCRIFSDNCALVSADDDALAHIEEQTMLQNTQHAAQLIVNILNIEARAQMQVCNEVAVVGHEGLAVAHAQC